MDSVQIVQLIILFLLIICSGFFSASETALMAISKIDVRYMVDQNIKGAELVSKLIEDPDKMLGSVLVGNNVVNISASSLATVLATDIFGSAGAGIATGVITLLVLIFGEITPKSLSSQNAQKIALKVARPLTVIVAILGPVVKILMFITNGIVRLLGGKIDSNKPFITEDKLKTIVMVSHEEGILEEEERNMIYNVFGFGDSFAKDIMVPRTDIVAIDVNASLEEVFAFFKDNPFSRIPVFDESYDKLVGIIYIKDLLLQKIEADSFSLKDLMREIYFVHEYKLIDELFKEMREKKIGMAIVIDEYGGTSGLITMEDLIEEIVGDIDDEYDESNDEFKKIDDSTWIMQGTCRLSDVNEQLKINIESNEFDSIGGFIIGLLDRFPNEGEMIQFKNMTITVLEITNNRINSLKLETH